MKILSSLTAAIAIGTSLIASTPAIAEEQIYLMLMTNKGEAHSDFPMKDAAHCEEEGKKWMATAIKEVRGNLKSYYCVNAYRINAGS